MTEVQTQTSPSEGVMSDKEGKYSKYLTFALANEAYGLGQIPLDDMD